MGLTAKAYVGYGVDLSGARVAYSDADLTDDYEDARVARFGCVLRAAGGVDGPRVLFVRDSLLTVSEYQGVVAMRPAVPSEVAWRLRLTGAAKALGLAAPDIDAMRWLVAVDRS